MKLRQWLPALGLVIAAPAVLAQTAPTPPASPEPVDALTVVRDAATGRLRAPTTEEAQELAQQRQAAQARSASRMRIAAAPVAGPLMRNHAGGAASVRVTEDFASLVVATRGADGKLRQQCVTSKQAAEEAIDHAGHDHAKE